MKFFRTEDTVKFQSGAILGLNETQSKPRLLSKSIRAGKGGKFEVVTEIEFKKGEVIGVDGAIPKVLLSKFTAIEEEKKK